MQEKQIIILKRPGACFIIVILSLLFTISCKEVYEPDINASQNALVVEGLLTDQFQPCAVKLRTAVPYDSSGYGKAILHAKVYITDDNGTKYPLSELGNGAYATNPATLVGRPGKNYTLHIETKEGDIYESAPQLMLPNDFNDKVHAIQTVKESLIEDYYGEVTKIQTKGMDLLCDITANENDLPRFRFTIRVAREYQYSVPLSLMLTLFFDCWEQFDINDLANITEEKYRTASNDIVNHSMLFLADESSRGAFYKDSFINAAITDRIVRVTRYRLNPETFEYYKNMNKLLSAEGKIFDPVAVQLKGNITCINHPEKLALGYFEASSVNISAFRFLPNNTHVMRTENITLHDPGCKIDTFGYSF